MRGASRCAGNSRHVAAQLSSAINRLADGRALAMGFPARRRDYPALPVNVVFGALAAFVAYGRLVIVPA